MDKINEYQIEGKAGEYCIQVPENSTILSVRKTARSSKITVGVLVDLDNADNMIEKCLLVFDTESEIGDNMKANYIGCVVTGINTTSTSLKEDVFYVFEKLR